MATDLLDGLLDFLSQQLEGVEFCRAWSPGWGSRLVEQPVVSGEVLSSQWTGEQGETVIRLSVFAPEARALRETADGLEQALRQSCPGCVGLLREEEGEDSQTRLHCLSLRLTFPTGDANGYEGIPVELGGKSYRVAGVSVAMSLSGKELVGSRGGGPLCCGGCPLGVPGGASGHPGSRPGAAGSVHRPDWGCPLHGMPVEKTGLGVGDRCIPGVGM